MKRDDEIFARLEAVGKLEKSVLAIGFKQAEIAKLYRSVR